ncbi:MAG: hypothetical protein ABI968_00145, partial [Acidobacteriota bacterium]
MRRLLSVSLLLVLLSWVPLSATPNALALPDLFRKAKEQVKLGSYDAALATLHEIEAASQQAGLERDREALRPSLAFYKGVCHAALGKDEEARQLFAVYLEATPNARLDPAMYPKRVISSFEAVQKSVARPQPEEPKGPGIGTAYRAYKTPDAAIHPPVDENWDEGPARFLLTPNEGDEFRRLTDPIARSEFITKFW